MDGTGFELVSKAGGTSSDTDDGIAMSMAPRKTSKSTLTSPVSEETFFVKSVSAGEGNSFFSSF